MTIQEISTVSPVDSQSLDEKKGGIILVDNEFVDDIDPKEERAFVRFSPFPPDTKNSNWPARFGD